MTSLNNKISPRRYCFDISGIIDFIGSSGKYTGIQRVVVMAAWSFYDALPDNQKANVYVGFYDRTTRKYRCVSFNQVKDFIKDADLLAEAFSIRSRRYGSNNPIESFLKKYKSNPVKYYFHLWRLDAFSFLKNDAKFLKFNTNSKGWRQLRRGRAITEIEIETSRVTSVNASSIFRVDDILFLLDAAWQYTHSSKISKIASMGVKTLTMVHDLIPLKMTGYTDPSIPSAYANWLLSSHAHTTAYLSVSESTRKDLQQFLESVYVEKEIHVVPLVQGFDRPEGRNLAVVALTEKIPKDVYADFLEVISIEPSLRMYKTTPFILCVGTLEIRKNPMRLLQAWKQLIDRSAGDIPKLVFAGQMGWLIDDFKYALEASGNLHGYIDIIERPSDEDLSFLYRNCLFTVMPSLYEGWGLPVGEALSFGKTAVVANTSSLPEVGKDLVEYCDPMSVSSISDAVWKLISEPDRRITLEGKIKKATLRNWQDVGRDLIRIAQEI